MKSLMLRRIYKAVAVPFYKFEGKLAKAFAAHVFKRLYISEWCVDAPEQFDHDIDLYYQWGKKGSPHWLERGVYNLLAIKMFEKPVLVELCCGEGFNTKYFYSTSCEKIWGGDFDNIAIHEAIKKHSACNITFEVADIRKNIPVTIDGMSPTNVIWDTAIEHFTEDEIDSIMKRIKEVLTDKKGIISGHTIVEREEKSLEQHEYEFKNKEDLKRFFVPYFNNVIVWETVYQDRHNLYFMASDGQLPFTESWSGWARKLSQ